MYNFTKVELPDNDTPNCSNSHSNNSNSKVLSVSAGLTAIIGRTNGTLYTFGVNTYGQCGVGESSNTIWSPQYVMGLSSESVNEWDLEERKHMEQDAGVRMVQIQLGLQHGIALDEHGVVYTFGKNERGQLGHAVPLVNQHLDDDDDGDTSLLDKLQYKPFRPYADVVSGVPQDEVVREVACGMNHCAVLCESNAVYVWGKNMGLSLENPTNDAEHELQQRKSGADDDVDTNYTAKKRKLADVILPTKISGLPSDNANKVPIVALTCGSHHTAMLLEDGSVWAVGIAWDAPVLIDHAVQLLSPGKIKLPVRQFDAAFDRTVIVSGDGTDVMELRLWSNLAGSSASSSLSGGVDDDVDADRPENVWLGDEHVSTSPDWLEQLDADVKVRSVHNGWKHTIIITDD